MTIEILNKTLENDWESDLISLDISPKQTGGKKLKPDRINIIWDNVTGSFDGDLSIYINDLDNILTLAANITISSASNIDDSTVFIVTSSFDKLKFKFAKNGIIAGNIKILVTYL